MSDTNKLEVATKESVALLIANQIANGEKLFPDTSDYRNKFLDLYTECLEATSNQREVS